MDKSLKEKFDTPCLVVDEEIVRENIREMQNEADNNGCILRPHIKTHKTPYLAKLQVGAGACGITSCKVSEAEVMATMDLTTFLLPIPWWVQGNWSELVPSANGSSG